MCVCASVCANIYFKKARACATGVLGKKNTSYMEWHHGPLPSARKSERKEDVSLPYPGPSWNDAHDSLQREHVTSSITLSH